MGSTVHRESGSGSPLRDECTVEQAESGNVLCTGRNRLRGLSDAGSSGISRSVHAASRKITPHEHPFRFVESARDMRIAPRDECRIQVGLLDIAKAKPAIVRCVPRHLAKRRQYELRYLLSTRELRDLLDQRRADALPGMGTQHVEFLNIEARRLRLEHHKPHTRLISIHG